MTAGSAGGHSANWFNNESTAYSIAGDLHFLMTIPIPQFAGDYSTTLVVALVQVNQPLLFT